MTVRRVAKPVDDFTLLVQRGLFVDVVGAVKIRNVLGNHDAFRIRPWTLADPIARVDRRLAVSFLRREISAPCFRTGTCGLCKRLALIIGTG